MKKPRPVDPELLAEQGKPIYPVAKSANPPEAIPHESSDAEWDPSTEPVNGHTELNPTQILIWNCIARFMLCYGERASGKSVAALYSLVRHCYENDGALAIIIVGIKRQGEEGGAWHKLITKVLPRWEEKLGYDHDTDPFFTEPKLTTQKDPFVWIRNEHGGWSRCILMSLPVPQFVADRIKGVEFSFCVVDEAQTLLSDAYFRSIIQQLGRREGTDGTPIKCQQIIYAANPAGKRHWLYRIFFEESGYLAGKLDPTFAVFHVPITENRHNIGDDYWANVERACKGDEIEAARMLRGEWIDRPSGQAIFKAAFDIKIHVNGSVKRALWPVIGTPVAIGMDTGPANFSMHMLQHVITKEQDLWLTFDELNFVGQHAIYSSVISKLVNRLRWWENLIGHPLETIYVADEAAFNQQDREGSFDNLEIEKLLTVYGRPGKLIPCPKGKASRSARVTMIIQSLILRKQLISGRCVQTIEMLQQLESEKPLDEKDVPHQRYDPTASLKPRASRYVHPFDSWSYPQFLFHADPARFRLSSLHDHDPNPPMVYSCGGGGR